MGPSAGKALAGELICFFGCMAGFSECRLSLDCRFIRGVPWVDPDSKGRWLLRAALSSSLAHCTHSLDVNVAPEFHFVGISKA